MVEEVGGEGRAGEGQRVRDDFLTDLDAKLFLSSQCTTFCLDSRIVRKIS